jgi:uncharacterized protein YjdB
MNATNQGVTWSSSETGVATVSNEGVVTAIEPGVALIIITTVQGGFKDTLVLTVVPVTGVTLNRTAAELSFGRTGTTVQLTATVQPSGATINRVTWSTSDADVATVSATGLVTARGVGSATITAATVYGDFEVTCDITVISAVVTAITLNRNSFIFDEPGETMLLTSTVTPSHAIQDVFWSTSNPAIATVDNTGLVTAVDWGEATITATRGGIAAICIVFVGDPCEPVITPANIGTAVPVGNTVEAFLAGGDFDITNMSSGLQSLIDAYSAVWTAFDRISIQLPFNHTLYGLSARALSVNVHYTTTENIWPFAPSSGSTTLTPMTGGGNNENTDVTFNLLRRDRSSAAPGGAAPHSTSPPTADGANGFGFAQSSEQFQAILKLFTPSGFASTAVRDTPAADNNFIGILNSSTGWTILQDCNRFWFRSKADPTVWFMVERQ